MNGYWFHIRKFVRALWFLPALFSLSAVVIVIIAYFSAAVFPANFDEAALPITISVEALRNILNIVGASMLTVAVFALSTLVTLLTSAAQSGSPRAVPLFSGNRAARTTISVFIGAFLFSVVGIIGLSSGIYSIGGRLVLFIATLLVVSAVVWALVRWVKEISVVGRISEMTSRLESTTRKALKRLGEAGNYRCTGKAISAGTGHAVYAWRVGFVQHFDPSALQQLAEQQDAFIQLAVRPGDYVDSETVLARVGGDRDKMCLQRIRDNFIVGDERTFDSDPRYGLSVLADIARRALSPGVNDPNTAIHVMTVQIRLVAGHVAAEPSEDGGHDRISVTPIEPEALMREAFQPIAYEAASATPDVGLALLRSLASLRAMAPTELAVGADELARDLVARSASLMAHKPDVERLRRTAGGLSDPEKATERALQ